MKAAKPILALGLALTVLLAGQLAPAPASASWLEPGPGPRHFRALIMELARKRTPKPDRSAFFLPELDLKTKSGYRVTVLGFGETVALAVQRGSFSGTAYLVRGTATRRRLQASFGAFGSVSMRFQPAPNQPQSQSSCRGHHRFLSRRGVYVGKLRFKGEGGYVSVDARRAKGTIREIVLRCPGSSLRRRPAAFAAHPSPEGRFGPERPFLAAFWRHGITSVEFAALATQRGNDFIVDTETSMGRMAILRSALLLHAKGVFTHDDQLTSARVAPPAPFHGAGTYRAAPDGTKAWSGPLSVNFPGLSRFPLTGSPFEVEFGLVPGDPLFFF
jgi:hypothetical protein